MAKINKSYYAIIPADVRYSNISANAKLLYGEITALCNEKGYCWASNAYFAKLYKVANGTISAWIKQLKDKKFIDYIIEDRNKRQIFICKEVSQKADTPIMKSCKEVSQKAEHINTVNNTVNKEEGVKLPVPEIFKFYDELFTAKFKERPLLDGKKLAGLISTRLKQMSAEEVKRIIQAYFKSDAPDKLSPSPDLATLLSSSIINKIRSKLPSSYFNIVGSYRFKNVEEQRQAEKDGKIRWDRKEKKWISVSK